ncbi:Predicted PurR-regulated permease PerM [Quadrisphaera granulorum]|uniref:Putative PurR-regulated permease PerM n=1 Tax=Quadrisphaera granulorum TaxID=317664 RepID=A0A316AGQ4_9ACTN|nr:putative PurR-regulated permease PerM [Quadrisphaera granulorum]SZE94754.1 Predicted PurR-regulated permease PerM [Quadrisphaera granulorum]
MRVAGAWAWRILVVAVVLYGIGRVLAYFADLTIALFVSLLFVALLVPFVDFLDRLGWPRVLATLVSLLLGIALIAGLFTLVVTQIASGFDDLAKQASDGITQLQLWLSNGPLNLSSSQINAYISQARSALQENSQSLVNGAVAVGGTAATFLTGSFLVLFFTIFLTWDGRRVWSWLVRLLPAPAEAPFDAAMHRGWITLTSYVRATIIVAAVDAIGIGIGALALQIPLAVPLAVLVFLGAFVPIVGAVVTGAVAVLVGLVAVGPIKALIMLLVVLLVQQLESHVLQPLLLGKAVSVHPLAVFVAIAAGGTLAGIPGVLFAVPIIAVANTVIVYLVRGDAALPPDLVEHFEDDDEEPTADGERRAADEAAALQARHSGQPPAPGPVGSGDAGGPGEDGAR